MTLTLTVSESVDDSTHSTPTIDSSLTFPSDPPIMFFFDVSWNNPELDERCRSHLDKYFSHYAVGREVSKSGVEHYQVVAWEHKNGYQNLIATLKREFNLKGRSYGNDRKQYGRKRQKIESVEKCIAYSIKPGEGYGEYFSKNFDEEYLRWIHDEVSFEKQETPKEKIMKVVNEVKDLWERRKPDEDTIYDETDYRHDITAILIQIYFELFDNLPTRNTIMKILYKANILGARQYAKLTVGAFIGEGWFDANDHGYEKNRIPTIERINNIEKKGIKEKTQLYIVKE